MNRAISTAVAILVCGAFLGACSHSGPKAWDPKAVAVARSVALKVHASALSGGGCDGVALEPFASDEANLKKVGLPLPAAATGCQTLGKYAEGLSITVFKDQAHKDAYRAKKRATICVKIIKLDSPPIPVVDNGAWMVEPDTMAFARKLAVVLGGVASNECAGVTKASAKNG